MIAPQLASCIFYFSPGTKLIINGEETPRKLIKLGEIPSAGWAKYQMGRGQRQKNHRGHGEILCAF